MRLIFLYHLTTILVVGFYTFTLRNSKMKRVHGWNGREDRVKFEGPGKEEGA
jgi:hypothetical protein